MLDDVPRIEAVAVRVRLARVARVPLERQRLRAVETRLSVDLANTRSLRTLDDLQLGSLRLLDGLSLRCSRQRLLRSRTRSRLMR